MRRKKHLKVKRSRTGLGLFTEREIPRGDFVIHYTGELITTEEGDRRGGKFLFEINKKIMRDGKSRKNLARYINHSCRPNCTVEIDEENKSIDIYAKRRIEADEELTYHYGKEYWDEFIGPKRCTCEKCNPE